MTEPLTPSEPAPPAEPVRSRRVPSRLVAVGVLVLVIAAVALADRNDSPPDGAATSATAAGPVVMPVAFPAGSLASTWFCSGGTATADGIADHTVVLANPTDQPVSATVTVYPGAYDTDPNADAIGAAGPKAVPVAVGAYARASVHLGDVVDAPFAAALVEAGGGELAVEHTVTGEGGMSAAPSATSASPAWHFATGTVSQETGEVLTLFNPFPDTAVVDLRFATSDGPRVPPAYQALPIPGGRLVAVDVFAAVARHDQVSVSVVARTGRVVVDRIQKHDDPRGLSVSLGAPVPSAAWTFADGGTADGVREVFTIYNPGDDPAQVDVDVQLDDPDVNGEVEPVELTIDPQGYVQVSMNDEQRVPLGVAHSVTVVSVNGVPMVAERRVTADDPAPLEGVSYTLGSPLSSTEWVFAAGATNADSAEGLVVLNPSNDTIARVHVAALGDGRMTEIPELGDVEVPAAGRVVIDVGKYIQRDALSLVVTSTQVVVAERSLYSPTGPGMSQTVGVPLAAGLARS